MWDDLFDEVTNIESVKVYIWLKTRLVFDPPTTSYLIEAIERQLSEYAWRLMVQVDPPIEEEV